MLHGISLGQRHAKTTSVDERHPSHDGSGRAFATKASVNWKQSQHSTRSNASLEAVLYTSAHLFYRRASRLTSRTKGMPPNGALRCLYPNRTLVCSTPIIQSSYCAVSHPRSSLRVPAGYIRPGTSTLHSLLIDADRREPLAQYPLSSTQTLATSSIPHGLDLPRACTTPYHAQSPCSLCEFPVLFIWNI